MDKPKPYSIIVPHKLWKNCSCKICKNARELVSAVDFLKLELGYRGLFIETEAKQFTFNTIDKAFKVVVKNV